MSWIRPSPFGRIVLAISALFALLGFTDVSIFAWATPAAAMVTLVTLALWALECFLERDGQPLHRMRAWLIWPALAVLSESALQLIVRLTPRVMDSAMAYYDGLILLKNIDVALESVRGPILTVLWDIGYQSMFITPLVLWFAARRSPELRRTFLRAFLLVAGIGLVGYLLVPVVGPRFYFPDWYPTDLYGNTYGADQLAENAALAKQARIQPYYPQLAHRNCCPSLHTAWGILYLLMAWRLGRRWFWLTAPFALAQIGATVVLRWHYVTDLLVGAPLAWLVWAAVRRLEERQSLLPAPPPRAPATPHTLRLVIIFGLSGAAALLYEVAAVRTLTNVFGGMADAVATVLATYMVGLSLGAFIGGRVADRVANPIRLYAIAEGVVALTVVLLPFGADLAIDAYVAAVRGGLGPAGSLAFRVGLSAVLLLPPTLAMGATLPLLVAHWMRRDPDAHRAVPRLYGANTLGAAIGVLAGTYLILPVLGIFKTLLLVAGLDLTAALVAMNLAREDAAPDPSAEFAPMPIGVELGPDPVRRPKLLLLAVFLGSFTLFALEVQWTHVLAVVVGNSVYAFGVMLFSVLVGLAVGGRSAENVPSARRAAVLVRDAALFAAAVGFGLLLWGQVPALFHVLGFSVHTFAGRETVRFLICVTMLVPPCFLSGRIYTLAMAAYAGRASGVGRRVGRLSAASTVGAVVGSLSGSFLVLPGLGSELGLRVLGGGLLLCALIYGAAVLLDARGRIVCALTAAGAAMLLGLAPSWDIQAITNGANVYFHAQWTEGDTIYVHEDKHGGLTTVRYHNGVYTLLTNGKFEGNDGAEMEDQRAFAVYPIVHVKRFQKAMVIGLGSGVSAATVARFPFERVVVCEISPGIITAADTYFSHVNDNIVKTLGDDLRLVDGRHHLLITEDLYDLISIEISSIWFAGAASLYNREFYELSRARLAEGGALQQWVQLHHMMAMDLASVLATIRSEFPHVQLYVGGHQGILLASMEPLDRSPERLRRWCRDDPRFSDACALFGGDLAQFLDRLFLDTAGIDAFVADLAKQAGMEVDELISTDDSLYLEYATPRGNVLRRDSIDTMLERLRKYR